MQSRPLSNASERIVLSLAQSTQPHSTKPVKASRLFSLAIGTLRPPVRSSLNWWPGRVHKPRRLPWMPYLPTTHSASFRQSNESISKFRSVFCRCIAKVCHSATLTHSKDIARSAVVRSSSKYTTDIDLVLKAKFDCPRVTDRFDTPNLSFMTFYCTHTLDHACRPFSLHHSYSQRPILQRSVALGGVEGGGTMWRPVEAGGDVFPELASLDFGFRLNAILDIII